MPIDFDPYTFEILSNAKHVVILTGAGISSESGIPTFRGEEGLWQKFRPEELANFNAFMDNPKLVSEWYNYRRNIINKVKPNAAHHTLVEFESVFPYITVITQNVDGLHQKAGSSHVIELHGNIYRNYCIECGKRYDYVKLDTRNGAPACEECSGLIRPDVVWFGETLPMDAIQDAQQHAASADVMFSVGTSAVVYPAADLPRAAKTHDAYLIEINPEPTDISMIADETIHNKAGEALPVLLKQYKAWLD